MIHRGWRWVMRFDLSDDEWALLEPLMPKSRKSAHGTDRHGNPALVAGAAGRVALYRAGQAAAECLYRELQRAAARRDALHFAQSRAQSFGDLEGGLQHHPPAPRARQSADRRHYAKLSAPAMQRDGTLRYTEGSAPRPVASPSHQGLNDERTLLIGG